MSEPATARSGPAICTLLAVAMIISTCDSGGGGGHPTWSKSFGGDGHDEFFGASASDDQLVLTGAWSGGINGAHNWDGDMWVVSLDGAGNVLWQRALGVRNLPGEAGPPTILDLAAADDALWLSGFNASGDATILRTNLAGQLLFATDVAPHQLGRFEQAYAVAPTAGGAVAVVWAHDTIIESENTGHPDYPDVDTWEVSRWRLRFIRMNDDGSSLVARTLDPLYEDREPQEVVITGLQNGGAVAAVSLEDELVVFSYDAIAAFRWGQSRSGNDDAVGAFELPDGSVVIYGKSVAFSANADQGFATRFAPDGAVVWHKRFSEADQFGAGALACPAGEDCHLVFAGADFGNIFPPYSDVVRVDLDGDVIDEQERALLGFPEAASYDTTTDQYTFVVHRWQQEYEATVLDGDLAEVSVAVLGGTVTGAPEDARVAIPPGGPIYYYSRARLFLNAYGASGGANFSVPFDSASSRREEGVSALARRDGVIVTGHGALGAAWGQGYDATGNLLWQQSWPFLAGEQSQLAPAQEGGFWLSGDRRLTRMNAAGEMQWNRLLDWTPRLVPAEDGAVLTLADTEAAMLDADGAVVWSRGYEHDGGGLSLDSAHAVDGGWVLASRRATTELVVFTTTPVGEVQSAVTLSLPSGAFVGEPQLAVVDDLRVVATTYHPDGIEPDVLLVALNADSEIEWVRRYGALLREEVRALIAPEDGGLLMGGTSSSLGDVFDAWALRLDKDGLVGLEGGCQALLSSPSIEVTETVVIDVDPTSNSYEAGIVAPSATSIAPITPELVIARQCLGSAPGTGGTSGGTGGTGGTGATGPTDCSDVTPGEGFFGEPCRNNGDCLEELPCCTSTEVSEACGNTVDLCTCI